MHYSLKQWRVRSATALTVAKMTLATVVVMATAASGVIADNGIMLQIQDLPLKNVVMLLMQQSGANIVVADDTKLEKKVTASLSDVPLDQALDYVVRSAGVSYKKMDDGTYIIGGDFSNESVVSAKDFTNSLPLVQPVVVAPKREKVITTIKLVNSRPSELLRLMGWDGVNPMPNCEVNYPDMIPANGPSRTSSNDHPLQVIDNNGNLYNINKDGRAPANDMAVPTSDPRGNYGGAGRSGDAYTGAAQYPNAGTPGYVPGRPYVPGQTPNTPANTNNSKSSNEDFLWPDGVDQAAPFDLDNSIIVKGDLEGIENFKRIVRLLDVPPKQVLIEAKFVEVKTTDVKTFGIDWSLERLNESFNTAFGPVGNVVYGFTSGNLTAQLKAQLTQDVGRVINSPIISTINNQNASIQINNRIPYWTSTSYIVDNNIVNNPIVNWLNVTTYLMVLPRVNGDGTITMSIQPTVSDTGQAVTGPDGTSIPEQRDQTLFTQRRVADGETIVVGGFIRKNETSSVQKIPILGDLPIVGGLFRTTSKVNEDRELLIFITPKIIKDSSTSTVGVGLIN